MKHLFILNPRSFRSRKFMDQFFIDINSFFRLTGSEDYMIHISQFPRDAVGIIRSFIGSVRPDTVVRVYAVGGDGILFDCLNGIMGFKNAELAAMPYGQTNSFLRGFGRQAMDRFRDIAAQTSAPAVPLDVIRYGPNYALNFCSIGVEAEAVLIVKKIRSYLEDGGAFLHQLKSILYGLLFYPAAVAAILQKKELNRRYEISMDGEDFSGEYRSINIANGSWYGSSLCPVKSAMPNDGMLDVLLAYSAGAFKSLGQLPFFLKGRMDKFPSDFAVNRARHIAIKSNRPQVVILDGVIFYDADITVELLPGAVKFADAGNQGYLGALNHEKRR